MRDNYIRIFAGGLIIKVCIFILQTRSYNGMKMDVISKAISGQVGQYDFLFKLIFTAVTIWAGF